MSGLINYKQIKLIGKLKPSEWANVQVDGLNKKKYVMWVGKFTGLVHLLMLIVGLTAGQCFH